MLRRIVFFLLYVGGVVLPLVISAGVCASDAMGSEVPVGGRIVGPAGDPIAEAEVLLLPSLDAIQQVRLADMGTLPKPAARALTDAQGRFRLVPPAAGLFKVRVQAAGFVPVEFPLEPLIEPIDLPDAEMASDAGFTVKVTGKDGRALPGARVRLASPDARGSRFQAPGWMPASRTGLTDDRGTATLSRGEKDASVLSVSAPGYVLEERRSLRGTAAVLKMQAGIERTLEVLSADGTPAPGVVVLASALSHPLGFTDAKGWLPVSLAPKGRLPIVIVADDGRRVEGRVSTVENGTGKETASKSAAERGVEPAAVATDAAAFAPRTFRLPERLALKGRVIDARTRSAVAGGLVWFQEELWGAALTDASGAFALRGPAGRSLDLLAAAPGYMRLQPAPVTLLADGRPGSTLALKPATAIEGIVVDEGGQPLAGAEAKIEVKRGGGNMIVIRMGPEPPPPRAVTSSRGTFRLSPVDPENDYDLSVTAKGFAPSGREILGLEPQRTLSDVRVELSRGQTLVGQVVDGDGRPVEKVEASLRPARRNRDMPGGIMMMDAGAGPPPGSKATTDADGKLRIAGIASGTFDLELRRSGFAKKAMPGIVVPKGSEPVDLGSIVMEPGQRVHGLVTAPDGAPIEGVEVSIATGGTGPMMMMSRRPRSGPPPAAVTGPDGRFGIDDLRSDERVNLSFNRTGYLDARESGIELPRADPVLVTLPPASKVSGRVIGPDKKPVPGATVSLTRSSSGGIGGEMVKMIMRDGTQADDEGRFVFDNVRPGQIALAAVAPGWQEAKLEGVDVPQGKDVEDLELPLKAGASVAGRIVAPDGRPAIGARVGLVTDDPEPLRGLGGVTSDGDGYYRLEGLAPGKVAVEATHGDYVRTVKEIEARAGANKLDLHFEGGQDVSGLVTDASGATIAGAWVQLSAAGRDWGGPDTKTGTDGSFNVPGVGDGDYALIVTKEGFAPSGGEVTVHVAGKPVAGLAVRLGVGAAIVGTISGVEPEKLPQVSVRAWNAGPGGSATSMVDAQGGYKLSGLVPGAWTVVASLASSGQQTRAQTVLEAGATEARLDLQFGSGLTLSGRASVGESPVKSAVLFAQGTDVNHSGWGRTGFDGTFKIEGLEPGTYRVELRQWETGLSYEETVELTGSRDITLKVPTARIVGRVVDSGERRPVAGATVSLSRTGEDRPRGPMERGATSDLNGRFEIANVTNGGWVLTAAKTGYAASTAEVNVASGRDADDVRIQLDATEGVTLQVRLPSGRVPDTVDVAVLDASGRTVTSGSFATGENGSVRLSSVPPGSWDLLVGAGGSGTANLRVNVPGETVAVALPPACGLRVKVPALAGSATAATATIKSADGRAFRTLGWMSDAVGQWRLAGGQLDLDTLPPGSWTVQVAASDGRTWSGTSATQPGAPSEVVLQ